MTSQINRGMTNCLIHDVGEQNKKICVCCWVFINSKHIIGAFHMDENLNVKCHYVINRTKWRLLF